MQSRAKTVNEYLEELPSDRRAAIEAIRQVILANLDEDYEEGMQYGMIGYYVPHRVYPAGYHCDPKQPLPFVSIASQKNHLSIYLMCLYASDDHRLWFEKAWKATGRKLDAGKCCVRFKTLEDVALDVLGESIRQISARGYIEQYERARESTKGGAAAKRTKGTNEAKPRRVGAKKTATKTVSG